MGIKTRVVIALMAAAFFITQVILPTINAAQTILINTGGF